MGVLNERRLELEQQTQALLMQSERKAPPAGDTTEDAKARVPSDDNTTPLDVAEEMPERAEDLRQRYIATYSEQEQVLMERERQFKLSANEAARRSPDKSAAEYSSSNTYRTDQLDAYKRMRVLANDIVGDVLDQLCGNRSSLSAASQLETEYANWRRTHHSLIKRMAGDGSCGEIEIETGEEDAEVAGDDQDEEESDRRVALGPGQRLVARALADLAAKSLDQLVSEEASAVAEAAKAEAAMATAIGHRVLFGALSRCVARNERKGAPAVGDDDDLRELHRGMVKQRAERSGTNRHQNHLNDKWRGRRPRKKAYGGDSSSSSSDSEGSDHGVSSKLVLNEEPEELRYGLARSRFAEAEYAYWGEDAMRIHETLLPIKDTGAECTCLQFSPSSERDLLACGTANGSLVVWHLRDGGLVQAIRKTSRIKGPPDALGSIRWSQDGSELVVTGSQGSTRVWSVCADLAPLATLANKRCATLTWQRAQTEADERARNARDGGDVDAEAAAREAMGQASSNLLLQAAEERESWDSTLRSALGGGAASGRQPFLEQPPALLELTHRQFYHARLLKADAPSASANSDPTPGREWGHLYPTCAEFYPALTLFGSQPSILVAMAGGLIAKVNRPGAEQVVDAHQLIEPSPLPTDGEIHEALREYRIATGAKPSKSTSTSSGAPPGVATLREASLSRDFFTGHSSSVVLLGATASVGSFVSLDRGGLLLDWRYSREQYSTYGWFRPAGSLQLGLALRMSVKDASSEEILYPPTRGPADLANEVAAASDKKKGRKRGGSSAKREPSPSRTGGGASRRTPGAQGYEQSKLLPLRLPFHPWRISRLDDGSLVRTYAEPSKDAARADMVTTMHSAEGTLLQHSRCAFVKRRVHSSLIAACLTHGKTDLGVLVKFSDVPEAEQLRLQLINLGTGDGGSRRTWRPVRVTIPCYGEDSAAAQLAFGPHMDVTAADYAFVLVGNALRIYSLGTGLQVRLIRPSSPAPLDSLAVSPSGKYVAVGASQQGRSGCWLYELKTPMGAARGAVLRTRAGSARAGIVSVEQRVRENSFFADTDRAGALNEHACIRDSMQRTTHHIIELALSMVDLPPEIVRDSEDRS